LGFALIGLWLVASIIKGVNPLKLFSIKSDNVESEESLISYDSLSTLYQLEQAKNKKLNGELDSHKASAEVRMVTISSGTLNMRSAASTSAEIIGDISTGTEVKVYYCKQDSTVIGDTKGTWCMISNSDTEGWVWSAYLQ
jgi:uncharacterized protein YgiM (DUF1202 family)